ncbi:hypothetical protein [Nonomuraea sp. NPDC049784]|uniref:hypothetical protein n=1 Tax=Nonomuraea sp. NPDC049784 TaxID=3154361 RepID=UPI0033F190DE
MTDLAHLLDGLRCAACHTMNVLWLDPVRALVECAECGQAAPAVTYPDEGKTA